MEVKRHPKELPRLDSGQGSVPGLRTHAIATFSMSFVLRVRRTKLDRGVVLHQSRVDAIQRVVAEHFDLRLADMTSRRRPANIAFPRQVAMYLSRMLTKGSLVEIGEAFGGRDHGTVIHARRKVTERMDTDTSVRETVRLLESMLRQ